MQNKIISYARSPSIRLIKVMTNICQAAVKSKIRKQKCFPAPAPAATAVSRSGDPCRILKRGGLESSGQRLISSNRKTKRIAIIPFFLFSANIFLSFLLKKM